MELKLGSVVRLKNGDVGQILNLEGQGVGVKVTQGKCFVHVFQPKEYPQSYMQEYGLEDVAEVITEQGFKVKPDRYIKYIKVMPSSEVCIHMRVAGKAMAFEIVSDRGVQLFQLDGTPFSSPILYGEAGIFSDSKWEPYFYPNFM